jgi:hypothetical protein
MAPFIEFTPHDLLKAPIRGVEDLLHLTFESAESLYDALSRTTDFDGNFVVNGEEGRGISQLIANAFPEGLSARELMKASIQVAREAGSVALAGNTMAAYQIRGEQA